MLIVNLFYELARQHKRIKGFAYGKSYEKGAGNSIYPLIWLDDPVYGQQINNTLTYTCNVDILGLADNNAAVEAVQSHAFTVGITFAEKIKRSFGKTGFRITGFSFVSLRDYYDDNAAGYRFTYNVVHANPVDRCNEDFNPDKEFEKIEVLPDFSTDNPDGCAVFSDKTGLPSFEL